MISKLNKFILIFVLSYSCNSNNNNKSSENKKDQEERSLSFKRKAQEVIGITETLYYQKDTAAYYEAINFLDSAIHYDKQNHSLYLKKSELFCRLGLNTKGLEVIQEYNSINNNDIDLIMREGYLLEKNNNLKAATEKYHLALKMLDVEIEKGNKTKRLMKHLTFQKFLLISLVKDPILKTDFDKIKEQYAGDPEFQIVLTDIQDASREELIDYQITGGVSKTININ